MAGSVPAGPIELERIEELAALAVGESAGRVAVQVEQVEDHVVDRCLTEPGLHRGRRGQAHPALDQLEGRPPIRVEGDHLAVEDGAMGGELLGEPLQLGIADRDVLEPAALHPPCPTVGEPEHPDAVPLELEPPVLVGELGQRRHPREHRLEPSRQLLLRR
jgi:hypothetical protein